MVNGGTVGFGTGAVVTGGLFVITSVPSTTVLVDNLGVYAGTLSWTFTGGSGAGSVSGSITGSGTITAGSTSTKVDSNAVVLFGDFATATFSGLNESGSPVTYPLQPVEVLTAGQNITKAD
jgi:hypothetical protein